MAAFKCMICGGDLANDYLTGVCVCENCGNRWSLEDLDADYKEYIHIIEKLNKANELLAQDAPGVKQAEEAAILYKSAAAECVHRSSETAEDLMRLCKDGQSRAGQIKAYAAAVAHYEKKAYAKALAEFEKLGGVKDADKMAQKCRVELAAAGKRRIPYAVTVGMIIPAIVFFVLKERADVSIALCVLIFIAASALLGYAVWRNGVWSMIIEILSFVLLVPLLLFVVLAYVFKLSTGLAAGLAVGIPVVLVIIIAFFAERQ
ncbi:MAG: hypothetical protein IKS17_03015 [Firmicutes bacterium]|nr:hypothetical protein [Bacillota bacterium]